ncbi:MAG: NAD(P)-dependent oxidoreductase [Verrucomicrobiales bacterium]
MKESIGVIGLGIIGSRAAQNLRAAGYEVATFNRSPKDDPGFCADAAEVAGKASAIQIFVRNGDDLLEVVAAMKPALTPAHLILNHATVPPAAAKEAAAMAAEAGAAFLDCPFTGSKVAAENGKLAFYAGGDPAAVERARPILEVNAASILPVGDQIGVASVLKIATNMISATTVQILCEALAVARSQGVSYDLMAEAMKINACNSVLAGMKIPQIEAGDYAPHFAVKNMLKDARFGLALGEEAGLELPALAGAAAKLAEAAERGFADEDYCAVAKNFEALRQG